LVDLVKYRESLQELWQEERFRPVLAYLSMCRQGAYEKICGIDFSKPAEDVKIQTANGVQLLQTYTSLLELPSMLKSLEEQQVKNEQAKIALVNNQEGGKL